MNLFADGAPFRSASTDANGHYSFDNLYTNKTYAVQFVNPNAMVWEFTQQYGGVATADSNAKATGWTDSIVLLPGEIDTTIDAGLTTDLGIVYGRVWHDENKDGIQDPDEPGIENELVQLVPLTGPIQTTHTDKTGNYRFVPVEYGEYRVKFTIPEAGDGFSPADQGGNDNIDSDVVDPDGFTAPFFINAQIKKAPEAKGVKCEATDATPAQKAVFDEYIKWANVSSSDWDTILKYVYEDANLAATTAGTLFEKYVNQSLFEVKGPPAYTVSTVLNPAPDFESKPTTPASGLILGETKRLPAENLVLADRKQLIAYIDKARASTPIGQVYFVTTEGATVPADGADSPILEANKNAKIALHQSIGQIKSKCAKGKWTFELRVNSATKLGDKAGVNPLAAAAPPVALKK